MENLLLTNSAVGKEPNAIKFLINERLSNAEIKSACEKVSAIDKSVQNNYLEKFTIYCLISNDRKVEAQLIFDLLKERGFKDKFFEDKINFLLEIIQKIESIINKVKPEIIYTHHHGDLNIDHQIINKAVLTATRPTNKHIVKSVRTFEILSSSEWNFQNSNKKIFKPNK